MSTRGLGKLLRESIYVRTASLNCTCCFRGQVRTGPEFGLLPNHWQTPTFFVFCFYKTFCPDQIVYHYFILLTRNNVPRDVKKRRGYTKSEVIPRIAIRYLETTSETCSSLEYYLKRRFARFHVPLRISKLPNRNKLLTINAVVSN